MRSVKIKKEVIRDVLKIGKEYDSSKLFVAGRKKRGPISAFHQLEDVGGCDYNQAVNSQDLNAAVVNLVKLGYSPYGFIRTEGYNIANPVQDWDQDYGRWVLKFPGVPVVNIGCTGRTNCKKVGKYTMLKVKLVVVK